MARSKGTHGKKEKSGVGKYRSAVTGRYVTNSYGKSHPKTTVRESKAGKFADSFIERYPDTFHELSKR